MIATRLPVVLEFDFDPQDVAKLLAVAPRVDALERAARRKRDRRVGRRQLEDLAVAGLRTDDVVELALVALPQELRVAGHHPQRFLQIVRGDVSKLFQFFIFNLQLPRMFMDGCFSDLFLG